MKLDGEKIDITGCFRVGFDKYSDNYILETADTFGGNRYFIITEEQYKLFDTAPCEFEELSKDCIIKNCKSNNFFFSDNEMENTYEQNKIMWKYVYIDMFLGESLSVIHKKIGIPDKILNESNEEIFVMSSNLEIQIKYKDNVCIEVAVNWNK